MLATVASSRTSALAGGSTPDASALAGSYHLAFWIAAGLVAVATAVAVVVAPRGGGSRSLGRGVRLGRWRAPTRRRGSRSTASPT